jgi:hypothetical protein
MYTIYSTGQGGQKYESPRYLGQFPTINEALNVAKQYWLSDEDGLRIRYKSEREYEYWDYKANCQVGELRSRMERDEKKNNTHRYHIQLIDDANRDCLGGRLTSTDDKAEAERLADQLGKEYHWGVALVDTKKETVDWGHAKSKLGSPMPPQPVDD